MDEKDYYKILGLSRDVNINDIKKAYRKLAMEYHPDKNPGNKKAEEKFKEIGEAYAILSDPQKRRQYDQFGHVGSRAGGGFEWGGFQDPFDIFREVFGGGFADIFGMGGGAPRTTVRRGRDLQIRLKLDLEEIASGVAKKIKLKKLVRCEKCDGSGSKEGTTPITCQQCHGRGEVAYRQGFFTVSRTCGHCQGEGKVIEHFCFLCNGDGVQKSEETISVDVPAGVAEGQYITVRNAGNAGPRNGPNGDVIIVLEENSHKYFERHGNDIVYDLKLSFGQVAIGDEVEVPTLTGKAKISIASGTQSGKILRMRGKGIPYLNSSGSGDQLIRVSVYTPTKLSTKDEKLIRELSQSENMYPAKGDRDFFRRMKEAII